MTNKIILVVAISVLAVAIAALSYFLKVGGLNSSKTLTREKAATMIFDHLKNTHATQSVLRDESPNTHSADSAGVSVPIDKLDELQKAGLIGNIHPEPAFHMASFTFTDKAKPYFQADNSSLDRIILGQPAKVEVTGLSVPSQNTRQQMITANYTLYYNLTPFGMIIAPDDATKGEKSIYNFILYDDGWRLDY